MSDSGHCSPKFTCINILRERVAMTDLPTMPLFSQDEEYARQLQDELDAMSDVHDRGEVTVLLHGEPVTERVRDYGMLVFVHVCILSLYI